VEGVVHVGIALPSRRALLDDLGRLEEAVAVAMEGIEIARAAGLAEIPA